MSRDSRRIFFNDECMSVQNLHDVSQIESLIPDVDSVVVVGDSLGAFKCDSLTSFNIPANNVVAVCQNVKILRSLGLVQYKPIYEFIVGGTGFNRIYAICLSSSENEKKKLGSLYLDDEGKSRPIENERLYYLRHVRKAISKLPHTSRTWSSNDRLVSECFTDSDKYTINAEDWSLFVEAFDTVYSGSAIAAITPKLSRWIFYTCSHGMKCRDVNGVIGKVIDQLILSPEKVRLMQVHVGMELRPHEGQGLLFDLDKLTRWGDVRGKYYENYVYYRRYGLFGGMTDCKIDPTIRYVTSYIPSHHVLDPITMPGLTIAAMAGGYTGINSQLSSNRYGIGKKDLPKTPIVKLGRYHSYSQTVSSSLPLRIEFVIEASCDNFNRPYPIKKHYRVKDLSQFPEVDQHFQIVEQSPTLLGYVARQIKQALFVDSPIVVLHDYKKWSRHLDELIVLAKEKMNENVKPTTRRYVTQVYDIEQLIQFFIEGYHPRRVDITRLDKILNPIGEEARLPSAETLRNIGSYVSLAQKFVQLLPPCNEKLPFPKMDDQLLLIYGLLDDERTTTPSLEYRIRHLFKLVAGYSIEKCGCIPLGKTRKPDPYCHLKIEWINSRKSSSFRWSKMYSVPEVARCILHPVSVIGQLILSVCLTHEDIISPSTEVSIGIFIKENVSCIPCVFVETSFMHHYCWGQIHTPREIMFKVLPYPNAFERPPPPLYQQRIVQMFKSQSKLVLSGNAARLRNIQSSCIRKDRDPDRVMNKTDKHTGIKDSFNQLFFGRSREIEKGPTPDNNSIESGEGNEENEIEESTKYECATKSESFEEFVARGMAVGSTDAAVPCGSRILENCKSRSLFRKNCHAATSTPIRKAIDNLLYGPPVSLRKPPFNHKISFEIDVTKYKVTASFENDTTTDQDNDRGESGRQLLIHELPSAMDFSEADQSEDYIINDLTDENTRNVATAGLGLDEKEIRRKLFYDELPSTIDLLEAGPSRDCVIHDCTYETDETDKTAETDESDETDETDDNSRNVATARHNCDNRKKKKKIVSHDINTRENNRRKNRTDIQIKNDEILTKNVKICREIAKTDNDKNRGIQISNVSKRKKETTEKLNDISRIYPKEIIFNSDEISSENRVIMNRSKNAPRDNGKENRRIIKNKKKDNSTTDHHNFKIVPEIITLDSDDGSNENGEIKRYSENASRDNEIMNNRVIKSEKIDEFPIDIDNSKIHTEIIILDSDGDSNENQGMLSHFENVPQDNENINGRVLKSEQIHESKIDVENGIIDPDIIILDSDDCSNQIREIISHSVQGPQESEKKNERVITKKQKYDSMTRIDDDGMEIEDTIENPPEVDEPTIQPLCLKQAKTFAERSKFSDTEDEAVLLGIEKAMKASNAKLHEICRYLAQVDPVLKVKKRSCHSIKSAIQRLATNRTKRSFLFRVLKTKKNVDWFIRKFGKLKK